MNVIFAKTAGFCFGVNKAVNTVYEQIEKSGLPVYTYGPIIHNNTVVSELAQKGVKVIHSEEELEHVNEGTVIIRSHGVSKKIRDSLDRKGIVCVDATCPFVAKIHNIVYEDSKNGSVIVIAGNPEHPEVIGIRGWACSQCCIIDSEQELRDLKIDKNKDVTFLAQTTYNYDKFKYFIEIISEMGYHLKVCDTVCSATADRQKEAREIAQKVDAMIVIGDRHSSNSRKLYEICKRECNCTYFIETIADLELETFQSFSDVGITAGASTPKNLIEEVQNYVRSQF
jgi:4-hydroxy-3-methylbut-2-enyl diphosphate reductase